MKKDSHTLTSCGQILVLNVCSASATVLSIIPLATGSKSSTLKHVGIFNEFYSISNYVIVFFHHTSIYASWLNMLEIPMEY